jgi:hypothetical protein
LRPSVRPHHPYIAPATGRPATGRLPAERISDVALDQNVTPPAAAQPASAIENEIPAYRAISPHAVVGLICGVLAVISFASWYFLAFAVAAVLLGGYAIRSIRRYPDVLTGVNLAHAAIALGLIFGLSAVTTGSVQSIIRRVNASRFSNHMVGVLKTGSIADAVWYTTPLAYREGKTASEVYKEAKEQSRGPGMDNKMVPIENLKKRLGGTGQDIHFVKLEGVAAEDLDTVAAALLEVHGPPSADFPSEEENALMVMRGRNMNGQFRWVIESIHYPYKPDTYVAPAKPVDDGHGHGH